MTSPRLLSNTFATKKTKKRLDSPIRAWRDFLGQGLAFEQRKSTTLVNAMHDYSGLGPNFYGEVSNRRLESLALAAAIDLRWKVLTGERLINPNELHEYLAMREKPFTKRYAAPYALYGSILQLWHQSLIDAL